MYGRAPYGRIEYGGLPPSGVHTGSGVTTCSGESCAGIGTIPITKPVDGGYFLGLVRRKRKPLIGRGSTVQAEAMGIGVGRKSLHKADAASLNPKLRIQGAGTLDDTIPREDEEFALVLSLLD